MSGIAIASHFATSPTTSKSSLFSQTQFPGLDLSRNLSTTSTWSITAEENVQASAGLSGVASNACSKASDRSGIQVARGKSASMIPTAQDFERSLPSMANVKPTVTFLAEDVTGENAAMLERLEIESMCKPIHITSPHRSIRQQHLQFCA